MTRILPAIAFLVLAAPPFARAECPPSTIRFGSNPPIASSGISGSATYGTPGSCDEGSASWNQVTGDITLAYHPCTDGYAECQMMDTYVISGLPPGTLIRVQVTLHWNTVTTGQVTHTIVQTCAGEMDSTGGVWAVPQDGIRAPWFDVQAGVPFLIRTKLGLQAKGGSEAHATGHRTIAYLEGTLVSCSGVSENPTAATAASWGRMKATYR